MGLAGPRNRTKLSSDPNNTKWSRSTDRFGHKMLTAQGWKPGDTLGVKGAAHSDHYTAASTSHIRVLLRDDNLGLGAKRGKADEDQFGLDMFQGLLGRLNGKSDGELAKEEDARRDVRLASFAGKKYGGIMFVSAGFLVGDQIEKKFKTGRKEPDVEESTENVLVVREKKSASKKRKRSANERDEVAETANSENNDDNTPRETMVESRKSKSLKKEKRRKQKEPSEQGTTSEASIRDDSSAQLKSSKDSLETTAVDEKSERKSRKAEKKARKEAKRLKKEERRRRKEKATSDSITDDSVDEASISGQRTPNVTVAPAAQGRFLVRQRYIQQKRMAIMDQQALNEIFMIKTPA